MFTEKRTLMRHIASVHKNESYDCMLSKKSFKWKDYLRRHQLSIHSRTYEVSCSKCEKNFQNRLDLSKSTLIFQNFQNRLDLSKSLLVERSGSTLVSDSIQGSFLLARKCKPSAKQSVFKRSDFVCLQSKAKPIRTTCSCQSLATCHFKISTSTCGSQEFYRADRESKHHQKKTVFGSATYSIGSRCGGQRRLQRCHNQISFLFQTKQHQFHDDLLGRSSNPFQTAATRFYQRSFYSKLSSFVYANGSILSRHGERYFTRTVQRRLCLVSF